MSIFDNSNIPLCVDLDGTLIKTDVLLESFLGLMKVKPWMLFFIPFWLFKGKTYLKSMLAKQVELDIAVLPYNDTLIAELRQAKLSGRHIILTTASHHLYANAVAKHLGFFDEVIATDSSVNNAGSKKSEILKEKYGDGLFDYVGNSKADLKVWEHARKVYVVNPEFGVAGAIAQRYPNAYVMNDRKFFLPILLKTLRLHQWAKNMLIFVPLIAAHQLGYVTGVIDAMLAFLAFGLCASSVYVVNDLLDLSADRHHARKCKRGFAAGDISILAGLAIFPVLIVLAVVISIGFLPFKFFLALSLYYILTTVYSFWAKRRAILDVMFLAGLYTIRIIAGAAANEIPLSFWLLAFSMFIFLSLALIKRYSELLLLLQGEKGAGKGRDYEVNDLPLLSTLGGASGYLSVLVLALFVNSPEVNILYAHPKVLWGLCPLMLFWVSRIWLITHRGEMHDDPVVFAIKDPVSLTVFILFCVVFLAATIN